MIKSVFISVHFDFCDVKFDLNYKKNSIELIQNHKHCQRFQPLERNIIAIYFPRLKPSALIK